MIRLIQDRQGYIAYKPYGLTIDHIGYCPGETSRQGKQVYKVPLHVTLAHELGHKATMTNNLHKLYNAGQHLPAEILAWGHALANMPITDWPKLGLVKACLTNHALHESAYVRSKTYRENKRIINQFITKLQEVQNTCST